MSPLNIDDSIGVVWSWNEVSVLQLKGSTDGSSRAWEKSNLEETALPRFYVNGLLSGSSVPQQWIALCPDTVCSLKVGGLTGAGVTGGKVIGRVFAAENLLQEYEYPDTAWVWVTATRVFTAAFLRVMNSRRHVVIAGEGE